MGKHSNRRDDIKPLALTWAEAIDVGRSAIEEISRQFALKIRPNSLYETSDSISLLILTDLMGLSPNGSDEISRLMSKISPRIGLLPSADTALAAVNSTDIGQLVTDFRAILSRQITVAKEQDAFKGELIIAGDSHNLKRYSKLKIGSGKGKKRKRIAEDIKLVVGTKPDRGTSWAHKFITLASTGGCKFTLDMEPKLPLQSLAATVSIMLNRTELQVGKKVDILLWDTAAFSASFVSMMLKRGRHFVLRAPKNKKINRIISKFNGLYGGIEYDYHIDENPEAPVNLVIVSTDLLRGKKLDLPLVDNKEKWITLATDLKPSSGEDVKDFLIRIVKLYRKRWSVETTYRCIEDFHGYTHSLHYQTRLLLFAIAVLLYNIWVVRMRSSKINGGPTVTKHIFSFMLTIVFLLSWNIPTDEIKITPRSIDSSMSSNRGGNVG
jgi:hypothetical protein